jgi:hypothetical protein
MRFIIKELDIGPAQYKPGLTTGQVGNITRGSGAGLEEEDEESCSCGCNKCGDSSEHEEEIEITPAVISGLIKLAKGIIVVEKR